MDVVLRVRDDRDDGHEDGGLARGKVFGKSNVSLSYQIVILGGGSGSDGEEAEELRTLFGRRIEVVVGTHSG